MVIDGGIGFFKGLPFSLQFFDGFEEVPLLMSYAMDPERTIPLAIVSCYVSIAAIGAMVLFSGAGITPFQALIDSEAPLMDGNDNLIYYPNANIQTHLIDHNYLEILKLSQQDPYNIT